MEKHAAAEKLDKVASESKCAHAMKDISQNDNNDWLKAKQESMAKCGGATKPFGDVELYDSGKVQEKPEYKFTKDKADDKKDFDYEDDKLVTKKGFEK
jgi:hypothetical protein